MHLFLFVRSCWINSFFHGDYHSIGTTTSFATFLPFLYLKLRFKTRFQRVFTAYGCVFKEIILVGSNQSNYFENATTCSKCMLKTTVATQLKAAFQNTFSACVYCIWLRFQRNYISWLKPM